MITFEMEHGQGIQSIKGSVSDIVTFRDNPDDVNKLSFHVVRNNTELLEIYGSHARDMLLAFLNGATDRHQKTFKTGIELELARRKNDTHGL